MARQGFSKRERRGILYLCIAIIATLAIGPISDAIGCTRRLSPEESGLKDSVVMYAPDSVLANPKGMRIMKEERSDAHNRSDSIAKARKDSLKSYKKSSRSSGKRKAAKKSDSRPRSYRDEKI